MTYSSCNSKYMNQNNLSQKIAVIRPGIHTINEQFCHYLAINGYDVTLVVPSGSKYIAPSDFRVKYIKCVNFGRYADFPIPFNLYNYLNKENFDIVQSNEDFQCITWVAALYSRINRKDFFLIEEIYKFPRLKIHRSIFKFFQKTVCKFIWGSSKRIICHSNASLYFLKKNMKSYHNIQKLVYLPIGVNTEIFHKIELKNQSSSKLRIISVGRLIPHKDYPTLLKAIEHLRKTKDLDLKLTIIGRGELKNEISKQIHSMGLDDCVEIIDWVPHTELKDYYSNSDIFVLSSVREVMGAVILEAMACGLPVIVSDVGGAPDFVENGKNGYVFRSEVYLDLANKIYSLRDKFFRDSFSRESMKLVEQSFDWDVLIQLYIKIMRGDD